MNDLPLLISLPPTHASLSLLARELEWSGEQRERAQLLLDSRLPPLMNTQTLPFLLGVNPRLITDMRRRPRSYYRIFRLGKKGGGHRTIWAPRRFVKIIQRWTLRHILHAASISDEATGFRAGMSIFDNGVRHERGKNLLVVDIKAFFESVTLAAVKGVFQGVGYSDAVSSQLADLCAVHDRLPQGAPTSPALANATFTSTDIALARLARSWGATYSRYADDLAFSGDLRFSGEHIQAVTSILLEAGFEVNTRKTRIVGAGARQIVAGVVVNKITQPPRWKRRRWRAMFHRASIEPAKMAPRQAELRGIAAFVNQYSPSVAARYHRIAASLEEE